MTVSDTSRLQDFVSLLNRGRFDEAREYVSPAIVMHEPAAIPYGGDFVGLEGFDLFRKRFGATWRKWEDGPIWYAESDGTVVKHNIIRATSRATGRVYETPLAEFFTFADGKIVEVFIYYQDIPGFLAAIDESLEGEAATEMATTS